jgi:hypothetical protein
MQRRGPSPYRPSHGAQQPMGCITSCRFKVRRIVLAISSSPTSCGRPRVASSNSPSSRRSAYPRRHFPTVLRSTSSAVQIACSQTLRWTIRARQPKPCAVWDGDSQRSRVPAVLWPLDQSPLPVFPWITSSKSSIHDSTISITTQSRLRVRPQRHRCSALGR